MRNAEKRSISLWTRLYQTLSSTTPTPKQRSRTSKKEASSRPSRWTQTGRKRGTPPNRSCDQARKTPPTPSMSAPRRIISRPSRCQPNRQGRHTPPNQHKTAKRTSAKHSNKVEALPRCALCLQRIFGRTHQTFPSVTMRVMPINQGGASALR
jgi:hypothetical protein